MVTINTSGLRPGRHRLPCPECGKGPRDTALAVLIRDDGSAVWKCWRCAARGGKRGGREYHALASAQTTPQRDADLEHQSNARQAAERIWKQTLPLAGTAGAEYLRARYCDLPPPGGDLRFHPALYCPETKSELPALVARVTTVIGNRAIGIHRIWFRPGEIRAVKKMRLGGCSDPVCVRLWPDTEVTTGLGIAEGIETALAATFAFTPMWSTVDAGQMTAFPVVPGIESLTIFADYDLAGYRAAKTANARYRRAGINVNLWRSAKVGEDVNDMRMAAAGRATR